MSALRLGPTTCHGDSACLAPLVLQGMVKLGENVRQAQRVTQAGTPRFCCLWRSVVLRGCSFCVLGDGSFPLICTLTANFFPRCSPLLLATILRGRVLMVLALALLILADAFVPAAFLDVGARRLLIMDLLTLGVSSAKKVDSSTRSSCA